MSNSTKNMSIPTSSFYSSTLSVTKKEKLKEIIEPSSHPVKTRGEKESRIPCSKGGKKITVDENISQEVHDKRNTHSKPKATRILQESNEKEAIDLKKSVKKSVVEEPNASRKRKSPEKTVRRSLRQR